MAKRKSGALKTAKFPPPFPIELQPYNKPYSLGDIEYLAFLKNLAQRRVPGGSKTTELAIDDIERETKGDFGKTIKMVTSDKPTSKAEKDFVSYLNYLNSVGAAELPDDFKSIYGTGLRGTFFPKSSDERKVYKSKTDEPKILVQDLDRVEKFGAEFDKRDIDSRTFLEKLKSMFGYSRDDFSLAEEREKGTFPTAEEMKELNMLQGMERTKGEELDHYAINLLRNLGYKTPEAIDRLGTKETERYEQFGEEGYLGEINALRYGKNLEDLSEKDFNTLVELENLAKKELKKRRGYKQGGLVAMLKSFK